MSVMINRLQSCSPPVTLPSRVILPSPARRARSVSHNEAPSPSKSRAVYKPAGEDSIDKPFTATRQRSYLFLATADVLVWAVATVDESSKHSSSVALKYHYFHQPTSILSCEPLPLDHTDPGRSLVVWYWPESKTLVTASKNEVLFRRTTLAHGSDCRSMTLSVHINKKREYEIAPTVTIIAGTPYGVIAQQFDRTAREPLYFAPWSTPTSGSATPTGIAWDKAFYWTDSEGVRVGDPRVRYEPPFVAVCRHPVLFMLDASTRTRRQYSLASLFTQALGASSRLQCSSAEVLLIEPHSRMVLIQCALSYTGGVSPTGAGGLQKGLFLFSWENNTMEMLPADVVSVPIAISGDFLLFVGRVPESYDAGKWRWYLGRYCFSAKKVDVIDRYVLSCHEAPTRSEIISFWRRYPPHDGEGRSLVVSLWNGVWRTFGSNLLPFLQPIKALQTLCEDAIVKHQIEYRKITSLPKGQKLSASLQHRLGNFWRAPHPRDEILLPQMYS